MFWWITPSEHTMKRNITKTTLLLFVFCMSLSQGFAQYVLDTPDGKKVKLNPDGTWKYIVSNESHNNNPVIPKASTARYLSNYKKYAIWYDPAQWICDTTKTGDALSWDATFYSKDFAITGYCMDSRLGMPVDELETAIRQQWQQTGKILSFTSFKDTINNLPVAGFDMLLEFGGITYQYRGYVHSTLRGSLQFMVGTQKEIFEEDRKKIELLFKGISKL
jgi:hypothetical protein